jgi:[ribosomal protein S5]-alanine N-acetyltransferase
VATIRSARLDLVSLDRRSMEAIIDGRLNDAEHRLGLALAPDIEMVTGLLRVRLADLRTIPQIQPWLLRIVAVREPTRRMVGLVGFHGPPNGRGEVEIGYEIFAADRRQGHATEAAAALLEWAAREHGVRHFLASISPLNAPSIGVIGKLGFSPEGSQWDLSGGTELVFRLDLPPTPASA